MNTQVTVTLPEDVLQRAEWWALRSGRSVADLLADTIEASLRPLGPPSAGEQPLAAYSNEELLAAADARMADRDDERLSELLDRQQAGVLTDAERGELTTLMLLYQQGLLRKAQALREAVRRGLREPLQP
jgi:CopG-like RHH_1 or ribbon-helix-helix domain, RHH_5